MEITLVRKAVRCSVETMSEGCFRQIDDYLSLFDDVKGDSVEATERNINNLPMFKNGCFTSLQAKAFSEYFHK